MAGISRNAPCPCGSGKKHKHCCEGRPTPEVRRKRAVVPLMVVIVGIVAGIAIGLRSGLGTGFAVGVAGGIFAILVAVFQDPPPPSDRSNADAINFGK